MKTVSSDGTLGLGIVSAFAFLVYEAGGVEGLSRVAVLLPAAPDLLPKKLRRAIQNLEQTKP